MVLSEPFSANLTVDKLPISEKASVSILVTTAPILIEVSFVFVNAFDCISSSPSGSVTLSSAVQFWNVSFVSDFKSPFCANVTDLSDLQESNELP